MKKALLLPPFKFFTSLFFCKSFCLNILEPFTYLHSMHQRPFRVTVLSLVLNLTATRSEKIVTKSRVVSFFTISISGMFERWTSSRSFASYGRVSSNYSYVEPALTLLLSASSPVPLPSSSSEISSTSSSSSSISSSGTFLALLREWP